MADNLNNEKIIAGRKRLNHSCNPSICPVPMCRLPEELSALQIKTIMTFFGIEYKEIAYDFNKTIVWAWRALNQERKKKENLKLISSYILKRISEKNIQN